MSTFLNYAVSTATKVKDGGRHGRFVVTAEYTDGYETLSFHETKADADAAMKRHQAADSPARNGRPGPFNR